MLSAYPAIFIEENNGYSVVFPDLNHLATCGHTLDEALEMAVDCLAGYIYTEQKDGNKLPVPSRLGQIDDAAIEAEIGEPKPEGCFVNIVTVDVKEYAKRHFERSVKKTLTIPSWLNDAALEQGLNFSQVLQEALKQQLHIGQV